MDLAEYKGIYVIAEQFEGKLRDVSFELLGQARILADTIGDEVGAILIGKDVKPLAQELIAHGAHKVYVYDDPQLEHYNTTAYAKVICDFFHEEKPNVFLVGATNIGRDLGPRCAARLHTGLTADCTHLDVDVEKYAAFLQEASTLPQAQLDALNREDRNLKMTRPAFGGHLMATIICPRLTAAGF